MSTILLILSIFGITWNFLDYFVCSLVQDQYTAMARSIEQILDSFVIALFILCIVINCINIQIKGLPAQLMTYMTFASIILMSAVAAYSMFMGIWEQGQLDHMDFYKQVALMVLGYMCGKLLFLVIVFVVVVFCISSGTQMTSAPINYTFLALPQHDALH